MKPRYKMDDLRPYVVFAETVRAGSMSEAARRLGTTPSAVSQTIRALEARTGVTLLHRSTRKLALTEAGERCLPYCIGIVEAGAAATASLAQARDAPTGELRVAAPIGFAAHVAPALAPVLADWPQLRLQLLTDDRLIDLIDARVDIALRAGELPDSAWVGRKLCDFDRVICASPTYLKRRGIPVEPTDIERHAWLALGDASAPAHAGDEPFALRLRARDDRAAEIRAAARIVTTTMIALIQLCEQSLGLAVLALPDVHSALERGTLVRVLPEWRLPPLPVTLLTRGRDHEPAKVRVAIDGLRQHFGALPTLAAL